MTNQNSIRPMGILSTIIYWAIPAAILYVSHYILVPMYVQRTGQPYLLGYLVAWISTMAFFFIAALAGYRLEGNPFRLATFSDRYRLRRMSWQDWLWTLGVFSFIVISYFGLAFSSRWLAQWSIFAPHPVFPPEFGPDGAAGRAPGTFMGMSITGLGWLLLVYLIGWFLNIHIWQPWNLLLILPGALVGAFVVQRRKNTWILIISHGLGNAILLVVIVLNGFGLAV